MDVIIDVGIYAIIIVFTTALCGYVILERIEDVLKKLYVLEKQLEELRRDVRK